MLWFLRLFPLFRDIEEQANNYTSEVIEKQRVRDELIDTQQQRDKWQLHCVQREGDLAAVRSALEEITAENIRLEDRLEAAIEDKGRLWSMVTTSLDSERQSLRMSINEQWRKQYGTTPWPEAPTPPDHTVRDPNATNEPLGRSFSLPSQRTAMKSQENIKAWIDEQTKVG